LRILNEGLEVIEKDFEITKQSDKRLYRIEHNIFKEFCLEEDGILDRQRDGNDFTTGLYSEWISWGISRKVDIDDYCIQSPVFYRQSFDDKFDHLRPYGDMK
jgi:hypothetical protein